MRQTIKNTGARTWATTLRHWPTTAGLILAIAIPLAIYTATMPNSVVLEDDGLFLMNGVFLGVQHPPGYPVFTVVHHLFQQIPLGTAAAKGHILSATFAALACGVLYTLLRQLGINVTHALLGALLMAVSRHFWSQAIITEVYTLNALLFLSVSASIIQLWKNPQKTWPWITASACYGVGLANNWQLMVLSAPAIAIAIYPIRHALKDQALKAAATLAVCAGAPYLWLYHHWMSDPAFAFTGPPDKGTSYWEFVARRNFARVDVHDSWQWSDTIGYTTWLVGDIIQQTAIVGAAVAAVGLVALFKRRHRFTTFSVATFICNSLLLLAFLRNEYDDTWLTVFHPYPLVSYAMVGAWFAVGLQAVCQWLAGRRERLEIAGATAGVLIVAVTLGINWEHNDRSEERFSDDYAKHVFASVPADATLIVGGGVPTHVLGYQHFVAGERPDLRVVNSKSMIVPTNLTEKKWGEPSVPLETAVREHIDETRRSVHWASGNDGRITEPYSHAWNGATSELMLPGDERNGMNPQATERAIAYGQWLIEAEPKDGSNINAHQLLLYSYCANATNTLQHSLLEDSQRDEMAMVLDHGEQHPACLEGNAYATLERIRHQLYRHRPEMTQDLSNEIQQVETWLTKATELRKSGRFGNHNAYEAELLNSWAKLRLLQGRTAEAKGLFEQSAKIFADPTNTAVQVAGR